MSLVQRIQTRRFEDIINQGYRFEEIGSVAIVAESELIAAASERTIVVMGFVITTSSATDVLVSLLFKNTVTREFFRGYVRAGSPIVYPFPLGDERYSAVGDSLVITTDAAGPTVFTIYGRIIGEKVALGYIPHEGASGHDHAPAFPTFHSGFSSFYRGGVPT
jgi:hypothetical protein